MSYVDTIIDSNQMGYFEVIKSDDLTISVIDRNGSTYCGHILTNGILYPIEKYTSPVIAKSSLLFFELETLSFKIVESPSDLNINGLFLIARINYDAGNDGDSPEIIVFQEQYGNILNNVGYKYFAIIADGLRTVKIIDSMRPTFGICAQIFVNEFPVDVAVFSKTITQDTIFYLESVVQVVNDIAVSATAVIKSATLYPVYESGKTKTVITRAYWDATNNRIKQFSDEGCPLNIYVMGGCT